MCKSVMCTDDEEFSGAFDIGSPVLIGGPDYDVKGIVDEIVLHKYPTSPYFEYVIVYWHEGKRHEGCFTQYEVKAIE